MTVDVGLAVGWLAELVVLAAGLAFVAWRIGHRWLLVLTLASFVVRLVIGQAMYFISLWHLRVLSSLQLPNGFWSLGPDAGNYQLEASRVFLPALASGPITFARLTLDYFDFTPVNLHLFDDPFTWLLGMVYAIFGASPPHGLLLNAALTALCIPLVYLVARALELPAAAALLAAGIVAFWPSTLAWSAQLLKDPTDWLGLFAILTAIGLLLSDEDQFAALRVRWPALLGVAGMLFLASLRHYASATLLAVGCGGTVATFGGIFLVGPLKQVFGQKTRGSGQVRPTGRCQRVQGRHLARAALLLAALAIGNAAGYSRFLLHLATAQDHADAYGPTAAKIGEIMRTEGGTVDEAIQQIRSAAAAAAPVGATAPRPEFQPPPVTIETGPVFASPCDPITPVAAVRWGYIVTGGAYLVDPAQQFKNCWDVATYAPRAFEITFLSPQPFDPLRSGGATGPAANLGAFDTLLLWLLLPGLIVGLGNWTMHVRAGRVVILLYLVVLGFALGFGVANFGTLFRIRLQVLLPAAIIGAHGWLLIARWLDARLVRSRLESSTRQLNVGQVPSVNTLATPSAPRR